MLKFLCCFLCLKGVTEINYEWEQENREVGE